MPYTYFHRRPISPLHASVALSRRERLVWSAVIVHVMALLYLAVTSVPAPQQQLMARSQVDVPTFHGGDPNDTIYGSCFQGADGYTMCSPFLSVGVLLIPDQLHGTSSTPPQVLLSHRPGEEPGILQRQVSAGETAESTLRNLIKERIGLDIQSLPEGKGPSLLGMYSKPPSESASGASRRRQHTARAIYILHIILPMSPEKPYVDLVKVPLSTKAGREPLLGKLSDADRVVLEDYVGNAAAIRYDAISSRRSAHNEEIGPDVVRSLC